MVAANELATADGRDAERRRRAEDLMAAWDAEDQDHVVIDLDARRAS